jgi:esterase/lipase
MPPERAKKTKGLLLFAGILVAVTVIIVLFFYSDPLSPSPTIFKDVTDSRDRTALWHKTNRLRKTRGVALVIHGLNLKPEGMDSIISVLNHAGIDVLNLSLCGHGKNFSSISKIEEHEQRLESFRTVNYELWLKEVYAAYQKVKTRADRKKVPVFFVGYSMGALFGCDLLASQPDVNFSRMVLFAPALNVTIKSYMLKALVPFPALVIDSLAPEKYRSNDGTPMAAYKALFEAIEHFEGNIGKKLNVPTMVFIDEKDEFISYPRLAGMINSNHLDRWKIQRVQKDGNIGAGTSYHLIINEDATGKDMWAHIKTLMTKHLLQ